MIETSITGPLNFMEGASEPSRMSKAVHHLQSCGESLPEGRGDGAEAGWLRKYYTVALLKAGTWGFTSAP